MSKTASSYLLRTALFVVVYMTAVSHAQQDPDQLPTSYPSKTIRIIVGQSPGGGTDAVARLMAQQLGERWSRSVVVENRAGGTGVIAMNIAAHAAPDGHTLLLNSSSQTIVMLTKQVSYDIRKVYVPIGLLTSQPYLVAVNAALPVSSIKDLIVYAKNKPGAISFGSPGNGSTGHMGIELFKSLTGTDMVHVPYKGNGPAMIDLMAGQIQLLFGTIVSVMPQVRAGKIKALAVTSLQRTQALPELPTVSESGLLGYDLNNAYGFLAPAGTPQTIILAINRECNRIISTPEFKARLAAAGVESAQPNTPADYKNAIDRDIAKWDKFFKTPGLSAENFR